MFYDIHALFTLYVWSILGFTFIYYNIWFTKTGFSMFSFLIFELKVWFIVTVC